MFAPLKSAYRDQVKRLERGGVGTIGKQHFTYLYSPARQMASSLRNIRVAWSIARLYLFNPAKVLDQIPKPTAEYGATASNNANLNRDEHSRTISMQSPAKILSSEAAASVYNHIKRDIHSFDEARAKCLQKQVQKLIYATYLSFAEHALL